MNASELIFVGIDVSKETLEVAVDDRSKTRCIANAGREIEALVKELIPLSERIGVVLLEATGGFERQAAAALCSAGLAVMAARPVVAVGVVAVEQEAAGPVAAEHGAKSE